MSTGSEIIINEELVSKIVYAVSQAVRVDAPAIRSENRMETNNRHKQLVGDCINDNLRKYAISEDIELLPFNRYSWAGRILADHKNKITYSIVSERTLKSNVARDRKSPYYNQTILFVQNGCLGATQRQMTMNDYIPNISSMMFDQDEYERDYDTIITNPMVKNYTHYIIVYSISYDDIIDIAAYLFNKDFCQIDCKSLKEYLTPDYSVIASSVGNHREQPATLNESRDRIGQSLVRLKSRPVEEEKA